MKKNKKREFHLINMILQIQKSVCVQYFDKHIDFLICLLLRNKIFNFILSY